MGLNGGPHTTPCTHTTQTTPGISHQTVTSTPCPHTTPSAPPTRKTRRVGRAHAVTTQHKKTQTFFTRPSHYACATVNHLFGWPCSKPSAPPKHTTTTARQRKRLRAQGRLACPRCCPIKPHKNNRWPMP